MWCIQGPSETRPVPGMASSTVSRPQPHSRCESHNFAMAELSEEIKDLERSAAYNILDELYRNSSISKAEIDLYKSKYAKLHEMVIQTFENEQNFVTRAKQLNQRLMQEKIKLEKTTLESQEDLQVQSEDGYQVIQSDLFGMVK
eukprot:symbB.v1.2.018056.t1/scaffold1426.1/size119482/5